MGNQWSFALPKYADGWSFPRNGHTTALSIPFLALRRGFETR